MKNTTTPPSVEKPEKKVSANSGSSQKGQPYYGRTLEDFAPSYVRNTLANAGKRLAGYPNPETAEADPAFLDTVKLLGGFASLKDSSQGIRALLNRFKATAKLCRLNDRVWQLDRRIAGREAVAGKLRDKPAVLFRERRIKRVLNKAVVYRIKKALLQPSVEAAKAQVREKDLLVSQLKYPHRNDPLFVRYEAMLDNSIDLSRLKKREMRQLQKNAPIRSKETPAQE